MVAKVFTSLAMHISHMTHSLDDKMLWYTNPLMHVLCIIDYNSYWDIVHSVWSSVTACYKLSCTRII